MGNRRFLKKLEIEHYRGFFEKQVINFAIPNGKSGSGLTLITGPNNTGKTAIIEALQTSKERKFSQEHRHQDGSDPCILIYSDQEERCEFKNRAGGSQVIQNGEHYLKFEIIGSKKSWDHNVGGRTDGKTFQRDTGHTPVRGIFYQNTAGRLLAISENKEEKARFNAYMKKLFPRFQDWEIDTVSERDYVKYGENGRYHHAGLLGDGIISLFRVCAHLVEEDKDTILIIDQPEDGLHPPVKKALSLFISELSKDKQIILCTHSPYFVNWDDFVSGAKFVRLNETNKQCVVSELTNTKNYGALFEKSVLDWQRPELLDICAKEIMFSEKILFVEGKEDVGLIRK